MRCKEHYWGFTRGQNGDCPACTIDQLRNQLAEVEREKLDILRGNFSQICSYCGKGNDTNQTWEELQEHIKVCEKHPLTQALSQLAECRKVVDALGKEMSAASAEGMVEMTFSNQLIEAYAKLNKMMEGE